MQMESVTQKLIPGMVALICAFVFIVGREKIMQSILSSHKKFWVETFRLQNEIGKFGELFLQVIILLLGIGFFITAILLIYQYIRIQFA